MLNYAKGMGAEMELLLSRQNAHDIASKYAEDAIYIREGYGIATGRDGKCLYFVFTDWSCLCNEKVTLQMF